MRKLIRIHRTRSVLNRSAAGGRQQVGGTKVKKCNESPCQRNPSGNLTNHCGWMNAPLSQLLGFHDYGIVRALLQFYKGGRPVSLPPIASTPIALDFRRIARRRWLALRRRLIVRRRLCLPIAVMPAARLASSGVCLLARLGLLIRGVEGDISSGRGFCWLGGSVCPGCP